MASELSRQLSTLIAGWPAALTARALDYVLDGRVSDRALHAGALHASVRGYNGTYRVRVAPAAGETDCDCGRRQPCAHVAAVAQVAEREPDSFADIDRLLAGLGDATAAEVLIYVVTRTIGPTAVDGATALVELLAPPVDDTVSLDSFLGAVRRFEFAPRVGAERVSLTAEALALAARAGVLAERQGRTAGVHGLMALLCACLRMAVAEPSLLAAAESVGADLQQLLAGGGLNPAALATALREAGESVGRTAPAGVSLVLATATALQPKAGDYLHQCLLAAIATARAEWELTGRPQAAGGRIAALVDATVEFLLRQTLDDAAVALARREQDGPAGVWPLLTALTGAGRYDEAIACASAALATADGAAVSRLRRWLADLHLLAGRPREAVPYLAANFQLAPSVAGYRELRDAARRGGVWFSVGPAALACLRAVEPNARIGSDEGRVEDRADVPDDDGPSDAI